MSTASGMDGGNPGGRFFGVLLMAVGGLVATLSGLCTAGFLVMMAMSPGSAEAFAGGLVVVAIVGGAPLAVGVGLVFIGRALYRASRPKPDPNTFS